LNQRDNRPTGSPEPTGEPLFRETQRFHQWFFYLPIIVVTVVVWWTFVEQIGLGRPVGDNPAPNWLAWVLAIIFGLGFPSFMLIVRLITEVQPGLLKVRLFPFRFRDIPIVDIEKALPRTYSAMREYGGWGIRFSRSNGRAYNAHGDQGVQLTLRGGQLVLIGSQRAEELAAALRMAGLRSS
jgi:hypothetical protein